MRLLGERLVDQTIVIAGAGAAGIGIARLLRMALLADGASAEDAQAAIAVVDSHGLVHTGRRDLDTDKGAFARPADRLAADGFASGGESADAPVPVPGLHDVVRTLRPTILSKSRSNNCRSISSQATPRIDSISARVTG